MLSLAMPEGNLVAVGAGAYPDYIFGAGAMYLW